MSNAHNVVETVNVFVCNDCHYRAGKIPKFPADSGNKSLFCEKCGHFNIGSYTECIVREWLTLEIVGSNKPSGAEVNAWLT